MLVTQFTFLVSSMLQLDFVKGHMSGGTYSVERRPPDVDNLQLGLGQWYVSLMKCRCIVGWYLRLIRTSHAISSYYRSIFCFPNNLFDWYHQWRLKNKHRRMAQSSLSVPLIWVRLLSIMIISPGWYTTQKSLATLLALQSIRVRVMVNLLSLGPVGFEVVPQRWASVTEVSPTFKKRLVVGMFPCMRWLFPVLRWVTSVFCWSHLISMISVECCEVCSHSLIATTQEDWLTALLHRFAVDA